MNEKENVNECECVCARECVRAWKLGCRCQGDVNGGVKANGNEVLRLSLKEYVGEEVCG